MQLFVELAPVGQPGQRIGGGQVAQALLGLVQVGGIGQADDDPVLERADLDVKVAQQVLAGQQHPRHGPGRRRGHRQQALGLDIKVLDKDNEEIDLRQSFDDDDDVGLTPGDQVFDEENVATDGDFDGYSIENEDGEEDDFFSTGDDDEFEGSDNDLFDGIDDEF